MSTFYSAELKEIRDFDQSFYDAWVAAGNPKASAWVPIVLVPKPIPTATQMIVQGIPALINGVLTQVWNTIDITAEINAAKDAQVARDVDVLFGKVLFEVINDVRVLKGQAAITRTQFINYLKSKM